MCVCVSALGHAHVYIYTSKYQKKNDLNAHARALCERVRACLHVLVCMCAHVCICVCFVMGQSSSNQGVTFSRQPTSTPHPPCHPACLSCYIAVAISSYSSDSAAQIIRPLYLMNGEHQTCTLHRDRGKLILEALISPE